MQHLAEPARRGKLDGDGASRLGEGGNGPFHLAPRSRHLDGSCPVQRLYLGASAENQVERLVHLVFDGSLVVVVAGGAGA